MSGRSSFEEICVFHILDGLRDGLSHFSGPTRAALVYCPDMSGQPRIYDPQSLLRGHEPLLKAHFIDSDEWRRTVAEGSDVTLFDEAENKALQFSGLVALGGRSSAVNYQVWFTQQHPDMCSLGPTRRWLEYASRLFSQNYALQNVLNIDMAGYALQKCATHAVRDHLVDERASRGAWDTHLRIFPLLDAVLGLTTMPEEGAWPRGRLGFVEPRLLPRVSFLLRIPELERPKLENHKHVRKLLAAVERSDRWLVSDGRCVVGVARGDLPPASLMAEFRGGHGFLSLDGEPVCSFKDGHFQSSNMQANLVQLEEALLETSLDMSLQHNLFRIVRHIVNCSADARHGSTLVIDLETEDKTIGGQHLEHPLDLTQPENLELACALANVDGALHIGSDCTLKGFACLLDGRTTAGENRARGARFNSALRFTAEHQDVIVVVVSSDRPVSVIQNGMELTAACEFLQIRGCPVPPLLQHWLNE